MRRLSLTLTLLLAVLLSARAKSPSVAGTFQTSYGELEIVEMILMQDGDKVTGSYAYNNGAVEGTLKGRTLSGRWTEDGASGEFEFEFSRDGRSFEGWRTTNSLPGRDDWTGVMTAGAPKRNPATSGPNGVWVLVGKETGISHPSFVSEDVHKNYTDVNKRQTIPIQYSFSGTTDDFTVRADCDYEFSYTMDYAVYSQVITDKVSFHLTETGGFQPLTGPYPPGEIEGVIVHNTAFEGQIPDEYAFWDVRPVGLAVFTSYLDGPDSLLMGSRSFVDSHVRSVLEADRDLNRAPVSILDEGNYVYSVYFPKHGSDYPYDDFYVCFQIACHYDQDINQHFTKHEHMSTVYHFEWHGDGRGGSDGTDIPVAGWFLDIFGGGNHTNTLWTIFISGGAASLAIGAIAGALGGMTPPGGAGGTGGPGSSPQSPAEDERRRSFFRDDDPIYLRRTVRENPDGSMTLTDPGGGPTQTLYPKYDQEGNRIGWFNQNFTEYDDDGIREWARWRTENAGIFRQDTAQAARNVAEQRAMNDARDKADRERGNTRTADEVRQWEQRQDHLQRLGDKYGIDPEDTDALKRAIQRDMKQAGIEGAEAEGRAAWWDERIAEAQLTEKVCDTIIDNVGEATPQTKALKEQYHFFKSIGQRTMEGIVDNKGAGHLATKIGQGLTEAVIDKGFSEETWKKFSTLDKLTGGESGRSVGGAVFKSVMGDMIDGDKSVSEMIDNAVAAGTQQVGSDLTGKVVGGLAKKADMGNLTQEQANVLTALGGSGMTETVSNPVAEEISNSLNEWRKDTLGV